MSTSSTALSDDASFSSTPSSPLGEHEFEADRVGVGLSNAHLSPKRRQMLDLMNELHSMGVQTDIDLPQIAVIGQQSAGKSSLIEAITGVRLPRASGTCTRCPTECRLTRASEPWNCTVFLHFTVDERGQRLSKVRHEQFGPVITNPDDVEERHRRAQLAILSPNIPSKTFLEGDRLPSKGPEASFSANCVSLQIKGSEVGDISFCDLPGLIYSTAKGGREGDKKLVQELLESYIKNPNCLILLTIACETEFETQGAFDLVKQHDQDFKRTIGVLTKPDRIPTGEEDRWIRYIRNTEEYFPLGWYSVKQPDSVQLKQSITYQGARAKEAEFFSTFEPWAHLSFAEQQRLGTANVVDRLSETLSDLIAKRSDIAVRLPEIVQEVQRQKERVELSLSKLPTPPSTDSLVEMTNLLTNFSNAVASHVEGSPDEDGLIQAIRPHQEKFKLAIRTLAPDFRLCKQAESVFFSALPPMDFLLPEDRPPTLSTGPIYLDDVLKKAQNARTRELPNNYPFVVTKQYIQLYVGKWKAPALAYFDAVIKVTTEHMMKILKGHFERFTHGHLSDAASRSFLGHMKRAEELTRQRLHWLMEVEARPFTLNTHTLADYKEKFLTYYKGCRQNSEHGVLIKALDTYKPHSGASQTGVTVFQGGMPKIMAGLAEIGLGGTKPSDLPKLLPADPFDPALEIMANVRAYFQVASKRFIDNVPQAVDFDYIDGMKRELLDVLYRDIIRDDSDVRVRCRELLREAPALSTRREELEGKRDRLEKAQIKLMQLF
ncbi:hypothetical protein BV25DRAFT_1834706 [Artomyces pyxidatus]|uniref:Uncharacterized protein n=1 Tax=Artomyces pyxidatus TaxID=48021 RepID=A0ACB8TGS7_9AGAM|nr:hypothetical protein BV25DRAFT_1834706 [Artomyces pyxidatus]